jgi:hypothetical protein
MLHINNPKMRKVPADRPSWHKVVTYLRNIHGCTHSGVTTNFEELLETIGSTRAGKSGMNPEFAAFLKEFVVGYAK